MLDEERDLADIAVFDKQMLCQTDSGVEVEVAHGKRLLVDVPHALLRVEEKEIRVERKRTLREALRDAHLEFHVAVGARRGLRSYRCAGGSRIKMIGTEARKDMEKLFDSKVFLKLFVKVKAGWSDDARALKSLGYDDFER